MRQGRIRHHSGNRRGGGLLVVAMVALLVTSALGAVLVRAALQISLQRDRNRQQIQARWLSEAGCARGLYRHAANPQYQGELWTVSVPEAGGQAEVQITIDASTGEVQASAQLISERRDPVRAVQRLKLTMPSKS